MREIDKGKDLLKTCAYVRQKRLHAVLRKIIYSYDSLFLLFEVRIFYSECVVIIHLVADVRGVAKVLLRLLPITAPRQCLFTLTMTVGR
jgi:hypothetical protein